MKKIVVLFIALFSAAAFAQDLPRIAVYVTGEIGDNEKKMLGTRMLSTLINSGRYRGIERSNAFLAEVEKEHVKQRSGDIDDGQISEVGKQFGVKFVCIADITPGFGAYQVSARIVNVETAEVPFIGDASSPLKTMDDLEQVSVEVVRKMLFFAGGLGGATKQEQQRPQQDNVVAGSTRKGQIEIDESMDFTEGERWGTWALNIVPGLGSAVIMKDYTGAIVNASWSVVGLASTLVMVYGFEKGFAEGPPFVVVGIFVGVGCIWNTYRSITYHHPDSRKIAVTPLQGLNVAVLPDQDGNIKGYVAYRLEF
jgi:hypothetical protein